MNRNGLTIAGILVALGFIGRTGTTGKTSAATPRGSTDAVSDDVGLTDAAAITEDPLKDLLCSYFGPDRKDLPKTSLMTDGNASPQACGSAPWS